MTVAAALPWAVWALIRGTGRERGFPLVPALAFTPYAAATALLPLAAAVRTRSRAGVALALASGAWLGTVVLADRAGRAPGPAGGSTRVRIATVSLRRGLVPAEPVVDLVIRHDVDVLVVQELTPDAERRLTGAGLLRALPHAHVIPARPGAVVSASGAVWSRLPLTPHGSVAGGFEQPTVRLDRADGPRLEITAVHTRPPATSPAAVRGWAADLAALPSPAPEVLRVLAGDFNATADHAAFRDVLRRGYVDAARAAGRGLAWTWRPLRLRFPWLTLDHVLVDPRLAVAGCVPVPVRGSDHRALVVDLVLPPGGAAG
ncbi:endonuclease/exonuclease/phosphatase (EEP) superfamily protein YafD [Blastococcus xanthinilyticus]|uniref:Endonuclease/exonuclease/phosphatase (EEP) superfamily protein YafD n=1 Tax=Blastococcus xanthinilyticus TaxID=1564164 RepID=A0A5S5CRH4_9ACTN|nr:endonuclease/exonuclease/phosphatase (EEP) superfamily protein YafD [Blastococcus xanthinilyticus]